MTTSTTSIASAGEGEALPPVATRPERLYKFIHDVVATPQYAKERHLLVGNCKPNTTLMVQQWLLVLTAVTAAAVNITSTYIFSLRE